MATEQTVSKRRRVFAKTFGIPGFIFALISMWLTIAQSLVAMTASSLAEILAQKFLHISMLQLINIPVLSLCFCSMAWAAISIVLCVISRFVGTSTKLNQTGFVLSLVSVICSASLACFSLIYIVFA